MNIFDFFENLVLEIFNYTVIILYVNNNNMSKKNINITIILDTINQIFLK